MNRPYGRIRFEVTANPDSDGAGDETFGVRLCTTADCTGGAVLGEWTVTITEPGADTTPSGTGATLTVAGGSTASVMEVSRNGDGRDRRATFSINITTAPTTDIAVVAYTETGVATSATTMRPFARINSALSPDYPPHGETGHNNVQAEYLVGYWASGATGSQTFTVTSTDNAVDSPGGTITGNLKFKIYEDNEAFRTTKSGTNSDTAYGNATTYSGITIPDLPVRVTDDDEPTRIRLLPTSPADNTATEGNTDKATVLVRLDRALVAGEEVTALLTFNGAALGTNFTLAAQSGQTGVTYADSADGTKGLVTLAGAGVQAGVIEVTALTDSDSDSQTLQIGMPPFDQPWRPNYHSSNLDGGVCAAHGCPDRPQGDPGQRFQSVTLAEAPAGLTITEHADPDARLATEGADYSYDTRLNTMPSNDVTVTVTAPSATVSGGSGTENNEFTFTTSTWNTLQTVTVQPTDNGDDEANRTLTVTHAFSGDTTYAALPDVTHDVTVLDDDPTTVTMAGAGVRDPSNPSTSANTSRIMVEGDATRVDRTLTISLGRPLEDGEYVRVPLRVEAVANGNNPSLPDDPPDRENDDPPLPGDLDQRRSVVDSARGPRASANVAWPPIHNDVVMTATGTGVTYEHSNRYTPNHIGFRYIEFRGAGAQTATIVVHAQDGFDDGEHYDEAFAITFPNNFYVFDEDTDQPFSSAPVDTNLGGGVTASPLEGEAWFGITDDDYVAPVADAIEVSKTWSLKPPGLSDGARFRLLYVTRGTRNASDSGWTNYDSFVRAELTGNQLKQGGVPDLAPLVNKFRAVISVNGGGNASIRVNLEEAGPDVPIYWVGGTKVADNKADFLDGSWDDETNPRHADGSVATPSTNGYWTGSEADGQRSDSCSGLSGADRHLRAGAPNVSYGMLNDNTRGPLGQNVDETDCQPAPNSELRPLYALSIEEFFISGGASIEPTASAAEGSAISFTVTITTAAPSGGITIPYTLTDGRGVDSDPVRSTATSADYSDAASGSITIAQGATTGTITINATEDNTYEGDHYFTVTLGTPTGTDAPSVRPGQGTAVGTITDAADAPTFQFDPATASASETGGAATLTITKTGTTLVPSSVTWTTADGTGASGATHPDDYTSATGTLQFGATDTSQTISIDITADSVSESAETFTVVLSDPVDATLGSDATATVTVTDDGTGPPPTVDVTISASSAVAGEGANGPRLTVTISRALTQGQTVTVPLTFKGATVTDDYGLVDAITASGVSLIHSGGTHTRQNPAVQFTGSGTSAELRINFRENTTRTQPYLVVDYGTDALAPSGSGVTIGTLAGGPIGIVLEDNETGDIEVPADWPLAPSGLSAGDDFRLLFRTSTARDATSSDIADYDAFIHEVLATGGHSDILPYAGFFKVFGSTRSSSGSTGTTARVHNDMAAEHTSHVPSGGWTDGSAASSVGSTTVGTPIYWLNGAILANNYADMCDLAWSGSGSGVRSGFDADDPRSEDGMRNIPTGAISNYQPYSPWTGTGNACEAFNHPLGASTVSQGSADRGGGQTLLHQAAAASTQMRPLFGMSPVFKVAAQAAVPELGFAGSTFSTQEGAGTVSVTVNVDSEPSANLTVSYTVEDSSSGQSGLEATSGSDFTAPSGSFTITAGATSGTISIMITDDNVFEKGENFRLRLTASSGYTVDLNRQYAIVVIEDNDRADLTLGQASYTALESGGNFAVTVNLSATAPDVVSVRLSLADGTATGSSGGTGADFDSDQLTATIAAGADTATFSIPITDDGAAELDETFTATLSKGSGGVTASTDLGDPHVATITIADDDHAQGLLFAPSAATGLTLDEGATATYTVRLASAPAGTVTVTITGAGSGITVDTDPSMASDQNTLTFTTSNWYIAQEVTVSAGQDLNAANEMVTLSHAPTGGGYSSSHNADFGVTADDDETLGSVTVTESDSGTSVSEDGTTTTDTYTVELDTPPASNVMITASAAAGAEISSDGTNFASTAMLTFTSSDHAAKPITVRGVNDDIDNAGEARTVSITHAITTGDGGSYPTSLTVAPVSVTVTDNDTAAVTVTGGPLTVNEDESDTGTYTVALATQPLMNVTITATAPAGTQVSDDGGTTWGTSVDLEFTAGTSGNWGTAQTVTVRGDDDDIDNPGNQRSGNIMHAIQSGNGDGIRYTPSTPIIRNVPVTVTDDDAAPTAITLSVDDDLVPEGEGATAITVTATVQGATRFGVPKSVVVTVTPIADHTGFNYVDMTAVSPFTITIPAGAQSATGMFTLTPDNDVVAEVHNQVAVAGSISGDTATTINPANVLLQDDDATPSAISLSVNPTSVTENGGARSISVTATVDGGTRFGNAKTVAVTVAGHNADGRVKFSQVANFNITINAEAASGAGSFTLTPTNNNWDEQNGAAALSGTLSGVTVDGASVTITDDDATPSGVALSVNTWTIAESAGATAITVTATVQGATRYGSAKTITVSQAGTGDAGAVDYTATAPGTITIAAGAASSTTSFTITPTDDTTDEFDETVTVSGTGVASISTAEITLTDDDDTTVTISAPPGGIAENGGTKDVTLTLSRALLAGETVTVPLEVVGVTAADDYTVALHPSSQTGVALSQSGSDSAQQPKVTLTNGASAAVLRFTAVDDNLRQQPYPLVRYGTGARAPSGVGVDVAVPTDGPVGFVLTDDETGTIDVVSSWGLYPSSAGTTLTNFRLVFVTSGQRDASSGDIADYDHFIRSHLAEGHADIIPYAGFFTVLGSTSGVTLQNHAGVTGNASMDFFWLGETTGSGERRLAPSNPQFRGEWLDGSTPSQQSVPRDESGTRATVAANGYFTGSTAAGARSSDPLGAASVTLGYLNDGGAGRAPLGSGQTAPGTATRSFYGLSPTFTSTSDPAIKISSQAASVTEGTSITFTIEADRAPTTNLPINLVVSDGGHVVALADEGIKNGAVTIAANTTSVTYTLNTQADSTDEPDAAAGVAIAIGNNYVLGHPSTANVTVEDNDAMTVSVSGGGGTVSEASSADYTVDPGRNLGSSETVTINFAPAGSATQASDYTITCHGTGVTCTGLVGTTPAMKISGGSGVRRGTIRVRAQTDSAHPETGETAGISLRAGHSNSGSGGPFSVTGTPSTFTISSVAPAAITASFGSATDTGTEASGSRTVTIPINLSAAAPSSGLNIAYAVHSSGTAASSDYTISPSGSVSIAQGAMTANITVTIADDMLHEGSETIVLDISSGAGYSPGSTARTTVTITDDDAAPTTLALSVNDASVDEGDGAQTITVTATVGGNTLWGAAQTVAVEVAGSGGANVVGFTAQPSTFNISIAAGAATGTGSFTLTPTDNNTVENAETVTVSGTLGGVTVSPATITLTDDDTAHGTPVTVTLSASDGDADGNAVEGASGATGYRTITITLGRTLSGSETVTVPLTVVGATVATDYTFALKPSSQAGVTLLTSNPHSAQNLAVRFASGAASVTLRLTPVNNSARTQHYVVVAYGSGSRAPSGSGVTLGTVSGGPIGIVLVDDETGDVTVPTNWGLKPTGLVAGDTFRLMFRSSTTRDATSSDIADYDAFIHNVAATMGHADILPYAGFFRVFGSTRSSTGSTGTTARVHNDMAAEHNQHVPAGGWLDGSAASSIGNSTVGTRIYWLNGEILAHNYADMCDLMWSNGNGVTSGWDAGDPRSEDGTRNLPTGTISDYGPYEAWTGTGNACEAYSYPLGNSQVSRAAADKGGEQAFLHAGQSANTQQRPLYGLSPVFKVAGSTSAIAVGFEHAHFNVREGTTLQATLTAPSASSSSATFTVNATAGTATSGDWSGGPWSVTLPANQTSVSFNVVIPSDTTIEGPERFTLTIAAPPQGFTLGTGTATVQIVDVNVVPGDWALIPAGLTAGQQFRLLFLGDPHPASDGNIATYDGWVQADASSTGTTPTPHAAIQAYSSGFQMVGSTAAVDAAAHTATGISESGVYGHTAWTTPIYWLDDAKIADDHNDFWDGGWDSQLASQTRGPDGQAVSGAAKTWTGTQTGATHATAGTASANPLGHTGSNVTQGRWGASNNPINHGTEGKNNVRRILAISQVFEVGATPATPVADFAAATSTVGEGSGTTNIRLNLSPAPSGNITVRYTLSGTATLGTDYTISGGSGTSRTVNVSAGATFVNIPVAVTNDSAQESAETIVLTLNPGAGYSVGTTNPAHTRTITDDDGGGGTPIASFAAAASTVGEASGTTNLVVNFSRVPSSAITLKYQLSGTATLGADYTISGGSGTSRTLSVSAGATSVNIPITITNDNARESGETIIVTLLSSTQYARNEPLIHTRTINDDDSGGGTPTLSIRGGSTVTEGGNASFTISANPAPGGSISVRYTVIQSGQFVASGQIGSNKSRTLSGGSATFTIPTQDDNTDEANGSVTVTLNSGTGYTVGSPFSATVAVNDNDTGGTTVRRPTSGGGGGGGGGGGRPQPVPITVRAETPGELTLTVDAAAQGGVQLTINGQLRGVVATTDEGTVGVRMTVSASDRALNSLQAMQITTETESEAADADPPSGFRIAGSDHIVNIVLRGTGGRPITELTKPATVCLPLSDEIVEEAGDDPLAVLHYDDEDGWTALSDSEIVTVGDERLLCAETTEFSLFAIGIGEAAPEVDQQEQTESAPHLIGALATGYSLVLFSGGSVEELAAAAEARGASVVYARIRGLWFSYFLSGPDFLNQSFQAMFKDGVPALTPLLTSSETASPAVENAAPLEWPWPDVCLSGDLVPGFSFVVSSGGSVAEVVACAEARGIRVLFALVGGDWYPYFLSGPEFISDKFIDYFAEGVPVATPFYATVPSVVSDTTDETETEQQKETAEVEETSSAERRGVIVDSGLVGVYHRDDCREDAAILSRFGWLEGDAIEILRDGAGRCADWVYAQGPDGIESWVHSRYIDESASAEPSTVAATSNTDAVVVNTANQGIALRSDCRAAARLDSTGWSEGQSLTLLREGVGRCDGWVFAQGPGPSWSWVHTRYLERD